MISRCKIKKGKREKGGYNPLQVIVDDWSLKLAFFDTWFSKNYIFLKTIFNVRKLRCYRNNVNLVKHNLESVKDSFDVTLVNDDG